MKYVQIDAGTSSVTWDAYFEYLRSARGDFPPLLYSYVAEWEHYSLEGLDSLHDAWMSSVRLSHQTKELTLDFLGSRHDRKHSFTYRDVDFYTIDLDVRFRLGDRDVLAHEFRAENGRVVHEIVFANKREISVGAADITVKTELLG